MATKQLGSAPSGGTDATTKGYVDTKATVGLPHDVYYLQTVATQAVGLGGNPLGVKLQRNVTFTSVTFRGAVEGVGGSLIAELRKNGSSVSGTSTTIAAGSQVTGGTSTGSWSFSAGDILTVYISQVSSTTAGTGLTADITGVTA